jgi:hypothetical protein
MIGVCLAGWRLQTPVGNGECAPSTSHSRCAYGASGKPPIWRKSCSTVTASCHWCQIPAHGAPRATPTSVYRPESAATLQRKTDLGT